MDNYREALRLNADNPEAQFNLGLALLHEGKREDAAAHLAEALRLKPDYAEARRQLNCWGGRGHRERIARRNSRLGGLMLAGRRSSGSLSPSSRDAVERVPTMADRSLMGS